MFRIDSSGENIDLSTPFGMTTIRSDRYPNEVWYLAPEFEFAMYISAQRDIHVTIGKKTRARNLYTDQSTSEARMPQTIFARLDSSRKKVASKCCLGKNA
jgi:hypothetical protein